jgi:hypothetical protein
MRTVRLTMERDILKREGDKEYWELQKRWHNSTKAKRN